MAKRIYTEEEARERKNARQREYAKRTGYAANNRYNREKTKTYTFRCSEKYDEDIIEWLNGHENKAGYIKQLIRDDIQKET
jgi:hypothetical protein